MFRTRDEIGLYRSSPSIFLYHLYDVYFGIKRFSLGRSILFVQAEAWKRANTVECRWCRARNRISNKGVALEPLVKLARKLDIFLPWCSVIGCDRGRERKREKQRDRGGEQKSGGVGRSGERKRTVNREPESISRHNLK